MDLTAAAIEKISEMTHKPEEMIIDGRTYTTKSVHRVDQPKIKVPLQVRTLQGIVDYIKSNFDSLELKDIAIHVTAPENVKLISCVGGDWRERETYVEASFKNSGHPFGRAMEKEQFLVSLLSNFEKTPERDRVIECIASIKKSGSEVTEDNGISQSVTVAAGISLVSEKTFKNPVKLQPIRTFTEVDGQPSGDYVFRMKDNGDSGISLTLHDSNGDDWEVKAINKIKEFFTAKTENIVILG